MYKDIVIVTGVNTPTGLTTIRALKDLPVELWGVTAFPDAPCCKSKLFNQLITVSNKADEQIDSLLDYVSKKENIKKPILLLSQDDLVQEVNNRRDELKEHFILALPDEESTELMLDKTKFQRWAEEKGYSVPAASIVKNKKEIEEVSQNMPLPFLIKPLFRMPIWDSSMGNQKVIWVNNRNDKPWETFDLFKLSDRYLVQSWIEGDDTDIYFCLYSMNENGEVLDEICGRKIIQWPKKTGSTAICYAFDDPYLLDLGRDILQSAGLKGLGSIEFKRDIRNGVYYITEPTVGRNDHQSAVAMASGHNLTSALIKNILGISESTNVISQKRSPIWIDELSTFRYFDSENNLFKLIGILFKNIIYGMPIFLFFNIRDTLPFIQILRDRFK